jgi:hypothetical protein
MNLPFFSQNKRQRQNGKKNGKTANGDNPDFYAIIR